MRILFLKGLAIILACLGLVVVSVTNAHATVNVVATLEHYGSIAKIIGGSKVKVSVLVKGYQNPHAVEVKPSFSVLLNKADLLVANGQLVEVGWLDIALVNARNLRIMERQPGFVNCSLGVDIIPYEAEEIEGTPFFMLNLGTGGTMKLGNHHYWLDPANSGVIARNIYEKLATVDPGNAEFYKTNYDHFVARLGQKVREWDKTMEPFKGTPIVSYHRSWTYLARRHGLTVFDYIEPKETIPPSAGYMASLVDRMKKNRVRIILAETYQDRRIVQETARLTGATPLILPASVSEDLGIHDLFQLFDKIYQELTQALQAMRASTSERGPS